MYIYLFIYSCKLNYIFENLKKKRIGNIKKIKKRKGMEKNNVIQQYAQVINAGFIATKVAS